LSEKLIQAKANLERKKQMKLDLEKKKAGIEYRMNEFYPVYEKELLQKYLQYKGNIRIFVRMRPILKGDFVAYDGTRDSFNELEKKIKMPNSTQIELEKGPNQQQNHLFTFDAVFGQNSTQIEVYEEVQHLITSFIDGNSVCIFSYG